MLRLFTRCHDAVSPPMAIDFSRRLLPPLDITRHDAAFLHTIFMRYEKSGRQCRLLSRFRRMFAFASADAAMPLRYIR